MAFYFNHENTSQLAIARVFRANFPYMPKQKGAFTTLLKHHLQEGQICGGCDPLIPLPSILHLDQIWHKLLYLQIENKALQLQLAIRNNKGLREQKMNLCQTNQVKFWCNSILLWHCQLGKLWKHKIKSVSTSVTRKEILK